MSDALDHKEHAVRALLRSYGSCIVAFSGGVDSALVVALAAQELGGNALAVTGVSPSLPRAEREAAISFARSAGARHELLDTNELSDPSYASNPANRCYFCKSELYGSLARFAERHRIAVIADGLNFDDLAEIRHGRRAADERGVRSPLAEAGLTKDDVRTLSRKLDLDVWDKPAAACLSSRFPTGTAITLELLERIEAAERALIEAGLRESRVRHHGDLARIEIPLTDFASALQNRKTIVRKIRATGYRFVTLDLAGYIRGGVASTANAPSTATIDLISTLAGV
ncbi:MAG: ATP-dependent sacrificial sulfur transferase LarE [Candidatus Eremiobacteraeota bacterium]|nr:ATP-dependent sacrificial sulfur transferase LarE [Candidatus Eremiobacteraeota bacterium]